MDMVLQAARDDLVTFVNQTRIYCIDTAVNPGIGVIIDFTSLHWVDIMIHHRAINRDHQFTQRRRTSIYLAEGTLRDRGGFFCSESKNNINFLTI